MTRSQMRDYYAYQVGYNLRWLTLARRRALALTMAHIDQRREAHNHYHHAKNALTHAREQLARCQPTKKG